MIWVESCLCVSFMSFFFDFFPLLVLLLHLENTLALGSMVLFGPGRILGMDL